VWPIVLGCLEHNHNWVRLAADRLLGRYFSVFEEEGGLEASYTQMRKTKSQTPKKKSTQKESDQVEWILQKNVALSILHGLKDQVRYIPVTYLAAHSPA